MDSFKRIPGKMVCKGISLNTPVDLMLPGKFPILENVRSVIDGTLQPRPGSIDPGVTAFDEVNVHTVRRLNDDVPGATLPWIRLVGSGTKLYGGQVPTIPAIDTGYDGNPLAIVPYRPPNSPDSWAFVGNANKMRKVNVGSTVQNQGIAAPNAEPSVALAAPVLKAIGDFDTSPPAGWTPTNFSGALSVTNRTNTTIANILYDVGASGWACINPTAMDDSIQPGELISIASAETVVVDSVINFILSTTIGQVIYDSGTTGPCSIALAASVDGLDRDALLLLDNAGHTNTEFVRVLSATTGPDGIKSIRCSTVNAHVATDTVVAYPCFRAYTTGTRAATNTLVSKCVAGTTTTTSPAQMAFVVSIDLGTVSSRPITKDDYLCIGIQIDAPQNLVEGKVFLDVDSAGGAAGTVFTQNFFYKAFRAADITPAATGQLTTLSTEQRTIQTDLISAQGQSMTIPGFENVAPPSDENPPEPSAGGGPPPGSSSETESGATQWTELKFKVSDLQRIGSDSSRTLHNVCAIAVWFNLTGALNVKVNSFWIGGTYGPDASTLGYAYRTRPRSFTTGAKGNPSPPTRYFVFPGRERAIVTGSVHADSQVDTIDFFRFGGAITSWKYAGSAPNTGTPTLNDDLDDIAIQNAEDLELDNFVPFPTIDVPRSGTCKVAGTSVLRLTGDTVNTRWGRGSQIIIGGIAYELDREPVGSLIQIDLPAAASASVAWSMPNPTLLAQPMACMWGPYLGTLFACRDPYQPGVLHATKASEPDSAPEQEQYEVTSPSEPLMNGGMYDNKPFVFSSGNLFGIYSTSVNENGKRWGWQLVPNSKGLINPWMLDVGKQIYFGSSDGIYRTILGGEPESITRNDLYKLFPHEGQAGVAVNGFYPPDFSKACQLNYAHGYLYFDYIDTNNAKRTMTWREEDESWWPDVYAQGVVTHYAEEGKGLNVTLLGGADGKLYTSGGSADGAGSISCHILPPYMDAGESRLEKYWSDSIFDYDANGVTITLTPKFNNGATSLAPQTVTNAARPTDPDILDLPVAIQIARNSSWDITWSSKFTPILYEWSPSYLLETEVTKKRPTDWDNAGYLGTKYFRGLVLEADTSGAARTVQIQADGGAVVATLAVNHNGKLEVPYAFTPFQAKLVRLIPTDANSWMDFQWRWIKDDYPEFIAITTEWSDDGSPGNKFVKGMVLEADTAANPINVQVQSDGAVVAKTVAVNINGRSEVPYTWASPFEAHILRLVPDGAWQFFKVRWVWTPLPERTEFWITYDTTHGMNGFQYFDYLQIAHLSNADLSLVLILDAVAQAPIVIPNSAGLYAKTFVRVPAKKFKSCAYQISSALPCQIFKDDCEVRVKAWGDEGNFKTVNPFADLGVQIPSVRMVQ